MKLNCAFWRYLNRCFGSWNCLENVESKEAKRYILALFVTVFWKLEAKWCIRTLFEECGLTTFRGAIECGNIFITEITLNKSIRYYVKLLASRLLFLLLPIFVF